MYYRDKLTVNWYICSGLLKGLLEVFTFQFSLLEYYNFVQKVLIFPLDLTNFAEKCLLHVNLYITESRYSDWMPFCIHQ